MRRLALLCALASSVASAQVVSQNCRNPSAACLGARFLAGGSTGPAFRGNVAAGEFVLSNGLLSPWGIWTNSGNASMNFVVGNSTAFSILGSSGYIDVPAAMGFHLDRTTLNDALLITANGATLHFGDGTNTKFDGDGTRIRVLGEFRYVGVATGSLSSCVAGIAGATQYDRTTNQLKYCNGSVWVAVSGSTSTVASASWSARCAGVCPEATNFLGPFQPTAQQNLYAKIACSWGTAGTGGTTGVVVKVRDTTGGTDLCSCTLGACTIAAFAPATCDCATLPPVGQVYALQLSTSTDCTVNPSDIQCNVEIQ